MPSVPSQQQADGVQRRSDLSKTLGECKGMLNAPSVGDGEMVEPAPSTGNQRIIRRKRCRRVLIRPMDRAVDGGGR
jgi:predicted RNA-binding Zn-ribbon protein involved in translation (DUF1610 family)